MGDDERDDAIPPPSGHHNYQPMELTGRERELYKTLSNKDPELGSMYMGVLHVLADERNPDRIALAAHGLRETMDRFPEVFNVPIKAQEEGLKNKVHGIRAIWDEMIQKTSCRKDGKWEGEIDGRLRSFLKRIEAFFSWFVGHHPARRQEAVVTLRKMDLSGRTVPPKLEDLNAQMWLEFYGFLNSVAHHGRRVNSNEFLSWKDNLEHFLIDRLQPRTFEDFKVIDLIIKEARGND